MLKRFLDKSGVRVYKNYVGGKWINSTSDQIYEIKNPATNETVSTVPLSNTKDLDEAVHVAQDTFKTWQKISPQERIRYMLKYQALIKENRDELAHILTEEQGKTLTDA